MSINLNDDRMCMIIDKLLDRLMMIETKIADMEQNKNLSNSFLNKIERKMNNSHTYIPMSNECVKITNENTLFKQQYHPYENSCISRPILKKNHSF